MHRAKRQRAGLNEVALEVGLGPIHGPVLPLPKPATVGVPVLAQPDRPPAHSSRYALRQEFMVLDPGDGRLLAASQPVVASKGLTVRTAGNDNQRILLQGTASEYSVVSWVPRATREQLFSAGTDYRTFIRSTYLELTSEVTQRVQRSRPGSGWLEYNRCQ